MADQSNLTILRADPSGSRPTGNLSSNWAPSISNKVVQYTANTIMSDPGATGNGETNTYYSEELCIGTITNGAQFEIGDTGDAQITTCWQYYKSSNGNNFNSGNEVVPGTAAIQDAGTWTDIGSPAQDYTSEVIVPATASDEDLTYAGVVRLRVKMVVTDAGSNGVAAGLVTAGVAAVNAAFCRIPIDKQAKKNDTINNPVTFGGIGKDPS